MAFGLFKNAKEASPKGTSDAPSDKYKALERFSGGAAGVVNQMMQKAEARYEAGMDSDVLVHPEPLEKVDVPVVDDRTEYAELAAELGYAPRELATLNDMKTRSAVLQFIVDAGWPVFDNEKVMSFLRKLAHKQDSKNDRSLGYTTKVVWVPLGKSDGGAVMELISGSFSYHYNGSRSISDNLPVQYSKLVPLDILKRVKALKNEFKERVQFFVSDYRAVNPDPFIAVVVGQTAPIVFGVWDEPGWGA